MNALKIGDLEVRIPIVQGGMGVGISLSGLASAVANEGGIGVVSAVGVGLFEPDYVRNFLEAHIRALRKEIRKARELSSGILGINAMVASSDFMQLAEVAIEEKIDIIFAGAGLPMTLPSLLRSNSKTKLVPIISSPRAAEIICRKWKEQYDYLPDAFVIEGPKAGGHLGFKREQINDENFQLESLVPKLRSVLDKIGHDFGVEIPIIAAGGIYYGSDIYKIIKLGASAVQMGTRFVTTHECDASIDFKNAFISAQKEDIEIINSPVGLPGRAIVNDFLIKVRQGEKHPTRCPHHCLKTCDYNTAPYCILAALLNSAKGKLRHGFVFAGENAYLTNKLYSVKETFDQIIEEYNYAKNNA